MPETLAPPTQDSRNLELLHNAELGVILERAYIEATNLDPRLENVEIVPLEDAEPSLARATVLPNEAGKYEVHLRLNDLDDALARSQTALENIPGAHKLFANKIGIPEDMMTPQQLYVFGFLHELGHITEFMDHKDDLKQLAERNRKEKLELPIGQAVTAIMMEQAPFSQHPAAQEAYQKRLRHAQRLGSMPVSAMMAEGTPAHAFVQTNADALLERTGMETLDELFGAQHSAYRGTTSESHADNFAAEVLTLNPTLVDQMAGNIDDYRYFNQKYNAPAK